MQKNHSLKLNRFTIFYLVFVLIITIMLLIGIRLFDTKKIMYIAYIAVFFLLITFFWNSENRKVSSKEIVIISTMTALAVLGRLIFFAIPQFKPIAAIVIISGICLGGFSGFYIGAMSGFVSNFFFGQGLWTPFQMLAFGIIGFISGFLNKNTKTIIVCLWGGVAVYFIYGIIMNISSLLITTGEISLKAVFLFFKMSLLFDAAFAGATIIFLAFLFKPLSKKINHVSEKYDLFLNKKV